MSVIVHINGTAYTIPQDGDEAWGTQVTNWITAVSAETLQKNTTAFTLTGTLNFGSNFGIKSLYLGPSTGSNLAAAGLIRMPTTTSAIGWRNVANNGDLLLATNGSDQLTFNSIVVTDLSSVQALTNKSINSSIIGGSSAAAGTFTDLSSTGNTAIGNGSSDALTIAPNTITWSNDPTHSGNHTFSGNLTVSGNLTAAGLQYTIFASSVPISTVGTGTMDLMTTTMVANTISANHGIRITARGDSGSVSSGVSIDCLVGGNSLLGGPTLVHNTNTWELTATCIYDGTNSLLRCSTILNIGGAAFSDSAFTIETDVAGLTLSSPIIAKITGAGGAGNTAKQTMMLVEHF